MEHGEYKSFQPILKKFIKNDISPNKIFDILNNTIYTVVIVRVNHTPTWLIFCKEERIMENEKREIPPMKLFSDYPEDNIISFFHIPNSNGEEDVQETERVQSV